MGTRLRVGLLLATLCALSLVGAGSAGDASRPAFGFTEDMTKFGDDGGAADFQRFSDLGVTENRVSVFWNADNPSPCENRAMPVSMTTQPYCLRHTF